MNILKNIDTTYIVPRVFKLKKERISSTIPKGAKKKYCFNAMNCTACGVLFGGNRAMGQIQSLGGISSPLTVESEGL